MNDEEEILWDEIEECEDTIKEMESMHKMLQIPMRIEEVETGVELDKWKKR